MRGRPIRFRTLTALILSGVLVLAFSQTASAAQVVKGVNFRWRPKTTSVSTGTKVVWKARQGNHNVHAYGGNWRKNVDIPFGTKTAHTFRTAGTYKFYCRFHATVTHGICSGMCGKIVVG
jgi:plastocyanin